MTGYQSKKAAAQDKLDSMEREALKLALDPLPCPFCGSKLEHKIYKGKYNYAMWEHPKNSCHLANTGLGDPLIFLDCLKAIQHWNTRTPLAPQPEQEPVGGWKNAKHPHNFGKPMGYAVITNADGRIPLMLDGGAYTFRSEAEAVLKRPEYANTHHIVELIANFPTAAQPAQEPELLRDAVLTVLEGFTLPHDVRKILEAAYYTAPPQRTWVGLTDEDIKAVNAQVSQIPPIDYTTTTYAKAIEAKLKEKNNGT